MWACLAAVVLPILAAVLGFIWTRSTHFTNDLAGLRIVFAFQFGLPVLLFGALGFVLALEWKKGLDERIKQAQDDLKKVVH